MYEERWDKEKNKENKKECGCCIKVEDSIVVIICGEVEIDKLKETIEAALET